MVNELNENFQEIDKIADKLKNQNIIIFTKNLIALKQFNRIFLLLGYPDKKVQKKVLKLLQINDPKRFKDRNLDSILSSYSKSEIKLIHKYTIHFLAEKDIKMYFKAKKLILSQKEIYEPHLIMSLVDENEAVGLNAVKILNKINEKRFPNPNYYIIMKNLAEIEKNNLLTVIKTRIANIENLSWNQRESIIRMLGALSFPPAVSEMQKFIQDSDENIRYNLAISLANSQTPLAEKLLFRLLLDEKDKIRVAAAESLGFLFPGLYKNQSPQNILQIFGFERPRDLLALMESFSFTPNIHRMWNQLGYNSIYIQQNYTAKDFTLIQDYIDNVILNANNSLKNSIILLISARMPRILDFIENKAKTESNPRDKKNFNQVFIEIQNLFSIKKSNGFILLL